MNISLKKIHEASLRKGWLYLLKVALRRLFNIPISKFEYWYIRLFKKNADFTLNGEKYTYLIHFYNSTWRNERCVEIPIIKKIIERSQGKKILEIGNVMQHYIPISHDVLDKYEVFPNVINEDVMTFNPSKKYDLIVSVSTFEHVGWDEPLKDKDKIPEALNHLKKLLTPGGEMVITIPIGYNDYLDNHLKLKTLPFTSYSVLKRISWTNSWLQVRWEDVEGVRYGFPFNAANAIAIGIITT